ncbi:hypothetical protein PAXRUDRAFT_831078 [Paxillus rubicundulus Ve08.2h10]|uniref:Uncharacterized protein n=1 Tax=Paxillus rubicundulus Ve08.2h10 TaxID=930991 RepID=A0A0D0DXL7_9AGAM|nr:hypothetical protein PAXRUDRAFT_831078 [Paxillus rubicundulus Ve08.2h10]
MLLNTRICTLGTFGATCHPSRARFLVPLRVGRSRPSKHLLLVTIVIRLLVSLTADLAFRVCHLERRSTDLYPNGFAC